MKKLALTIAVLLSINISHIWAEGNSTNASSVRYVKSPRFARALVEKWISEYAKTQPGVEFQIAKSNRNQGNIDLNVVFDNQDTKPQDFSHIVYFGEFAVLPITASGSEAAKVLEGKHLNSKKLRPIITILLTIWMTPSDQMLSSIWICQARVRQQVSTAYCRGAKARTTIR